MQCRTSVTKCCWTRQRSKCIGSTTRETRWSRAKASSGLPLPTTVTPSGANSSGTGPPIFIAPEMGVTSASRKKVGWRSTRHTTPRTTSIPAWVSSNTPKAPSVDSSAVPFLSFSTTSTVWSKVKQHHSTLKSLKFAMKSCCLDCEYSSPTTAKMISHQNHHKKLETIAFFKPKIRGSLHISGY